MLAVVSIDRITLGWCLSPVLCMDRLQLVVVVAVVCWWWWWLWWGAAAAVDQGLIPDVLQTQDMNAVGNHDIQQTVMSGSSIPHKLLLAASWGRLEKLLEGLVPFFGCCVCTRCPDGGPTY